MNITPSVCSCGDLSKFVADPTVPITPTSADNGFVIQISPSCCTDVRYCPICGGTNGVAAPECKCRRLDKLAAAGAGCIEYNSKYCEYHLITTDGGHIILRFCPSCGGRLPDSKRGDFFLTPDASEVESLKMKIKSARSIREIIGIIGPADEMTGEVRKSRIEKDIYGLKDVIETLRYTRLANTADLIIQQREDGEILVAFFGKPKKH